LSSVDRFGVWLSTRAIRRAAGSLRDKRVLDAGCGHHASFVRSVINEIEHAHLLDVSIASDLRIHSRVSALCGDLHLTLMQVPDADVDVTMCLSVLEHLWEPELVVRELRRVTRPGGRCLLNVPNWQGKRCLEFSAFSLGLSPPEEINDHKTYYSKRELWTLLRRGGFLPSEISVHTHKFGLNTFAVCEVNS
jgi:SAM-dependent methyltransferase